MVDVHAAERPVTLSTWADGFGVWHVRVQRSEPAPEKVAGAAIREELQARWEGVDARCWRELVRVPGRDDEDTVVYREAD